MIHTPVDASFQIVHIIRVLTHALARGIGNLCDIHTVAQRGFHDDIQCRYLRIIRDIGADSKSHLCAVPEMFIQFVCPCKIKRITEQ